MRIGTILTLALAAVAAVLPAQDCPVNYSNMAMTGLAGGLSFYRNSGLMTNAADGFTDQLKIVDLSNAAKLKVAWSQSYAPLCPTKTILSPAIIVGQRAYVPFRCSELGGPDPTGFLILDISNPLAPVENPRYEISDQDSDGFTGLVQAGSKGYASSGTAGLRVLDLADPLVPVQVMTLETEGFAAGIAMMISHVLILDAPFGAERGDGLVVVDISKPVQPRKVSSFTGALNPVQFLYADGFAYIADQGELGTNDGSGIWIIDLNAPASPKVAAFYPTPLPPGASRSRGTTCTSGSPPSTAVSWC